MKRTNVDVAIGVVTIGTSLAVGCTSEFYLQKNGEAAFIEVCKFFYKLCHNAELSFRITALLQNHGGDMMLPIFVFGFGVMLASLLTPKDMSQKDRNNIITVIGLFASLASAFLIGEEISTIGYGPNTNAFDSSGFDVGDIATFLVVPIASILFFLLRKWNQQHENTN